MSRKRSVVNSFGYAWSGIKEAFRNEPNFRIHIIAIVLVVAAGLYFNITNTEWISLVIIITLVVVLELINTAVEAIVDLISPKFSKLAKIAKDVAAAAVLIAAIAAIILGGIIFLPKISELLSI